MSEKIVNKNGEVIANLIHDEDWHKGLQFFSDDSDFIQVGTWNYDEGKELQSHIHNEVERTIKRTQEVIYVKRGSIQANIFGLDGKFISSSTVKAGDTLILLDCGHGYTILEDGTQVLEVKNGPYLGAEIDRVRI